MNGRSLARDERSLLHRDVDLVVQAAIKIEPEGGIVHLEHGMVLPWDYLVIATGARPLPERLPGLIQGGHEFYSLEGAQRLREALRRFRGGRIAVGVGGIPYKCPMAPVEFVFLVEEYLRRRGIRERSQVTLLSPVGRACPMPQASKVVEPILERRGIRLVTFFNVEEVDPSAGAVTSLEGEKAEYDLLVVVPPHRGQEVIDDSGLGDESGWVPTDRYTLQVARHDRIFAMGDATDVPLPKTGSAAVFEAPIVASRVASLVRGDVPDAGYDGRVMCLVETGERRATVTPFDYEHPPVAPQPSRAWHVAQWLLNRFYWWAGPQGRLPDGLPFTLGRRGR
jgi:sulfide:quinone oxidoreductase